MKYVISVCISIIIACNSNIQEKEEIALNNQSYNEIKLYNNSKEINIKDSCDNVIQLFNDFREDINTDKINAVSNRFVFPIKNSNLVMLINMESEVNSRSDFDSIISQQMFIENFNKIFPSFFKKCIENIDSKKLFEFNEYTTKIHDNLDNNGYSKYYLNASYDSTNKLLLLKFNLEFIDNNEKYETTIGYIFKSLFKFYSINFL